MSIRLALRIVNFNFNSGELSSDGGLFLLKKSAHRIGFKKVIRDHFHTNNPASLRHHTDGQNLMQRIHLILFRLLQ